MWSLTHHCYACFHKCIFMYCMKMYLPSEVWMRLWSKCVSVQTFYVGNSLIGQKNFGYYFLCQLQRPTVKLDSVELVIHTNTLPTILWSVLTFWCIMMMICLWKSVNLWFLYYGSHKQAKDHWESDEMHCFALV